MRYLALLILAVLVAGCTQKAADGELIIKITDVNPEKIFTGGKTIVTMDVENNGNRTIRNVFIDFFETGFLMKGVCSKNIAELSPGGYDTLSCELTAPFAIPSDKIINTVEARARYQARLSMAKPITMVSREEYDLQSKTGKLKLEPRTYSFKDDNIELQVEFSKELPLVEGRKEYAYFTVINIGSGFINSIRPNDMIIESNIISCPPRVAISPIGKTFPRIACEIFVPENINYLSEDMLIININYNYEVRDKTDVEVIR
ncbi:MAG: hypothetical protein V1900_03260 [Candidatus Aenigmatarchaeota archaeon]